MNSSKEWEKLKPNPIVKTNIISRWFYCWMWRIFRIGLRRDLNSSDLYEHVPWMDSEIVAHHLDKYWEREQRRPQPSVMHMVFSAYGWRFVPLSIIYSILEMSLHVAQPLFLGNFVTYFSEGQTIVSLEQAYLNAGGIAMCALLTTLCFHPFMYFLFRLGATVRIGLSTLVYRKCLRSSLSAENSGISGFAISVLSTDLPQFDQTLYFFYDLWKGPVEACLFGYIMYQEVGWPAVIGVGAIAIFIPLQALAAKAAAHYKELSSEYGDNRVNLMNEIITAIQVIKMYAWEKSFAKLVAAVRRSEVKAIRGSMNVYAALQCTNMISKLALFLCLLSYAYTGETITARKVFIVSSYFDLLNSSLLNFWPLAITTWVETGVCAKRILQFLMQSEVPVERLTAGAQHEETYQKVGVDNLAMDVGVNVDRDMDVKELCGSFRGRLHNPEAAIKGLTLRHLAATWNNPGSVSEKRKPAQHIRNISVDITAGQFVGVVGNVGAGKSTLLNAILGELHIENGCVLVNGRISYAPQEPWIFEASIRDNIVFVEPFNAERYERVLHACELERDLELLRHGDATIVGERGTSLSGGQRARIGLARAVYRSADIYMFDDPLAAVDMHVAKRLMLKCFRQLLDGHVRILVTHQVQHLKHIADNILLMEAGTVSEQGRYMDLQHTEHFRMYAEMEAAEEQARRSQRDSLVDTDEALVVREEARLRRLAEAAGSEMGDQTADNQNESMDQQKDNSAERLENQLQGSVKVDTYGKYFAILQQPATIVIILILFIVARGSLALMDIFVSKWATWEESAHPDQLDDPAAFDERRRTVLIIYTSLICFTLLLYLARTFGFFQMCLQISLKLHDRLFRGVIRATMYFFNTNASGRILNRFASDIAKVDVELPQSMFDSFQFHVDAFAVLVITALANVWLLLPAIAVVGLFYLFRALYIGTSRSLKRIEAITRSPLYSHTNQTFGGLTTIRALTAQHEMIDEFYAYQDMNTSALFLYVTANRAFALWTDLVCGLYIVVVTFSFLLFDRSFYSGDVGLAITQSLSLVIMCQWGIRQTAEMENNMTCVERVIEYSEIPSEPALKTDATIKLSSDWPTKGHMQFTDVRMRYSASGEYVLKGLNLSIQSQEKIGIVGRTGAGKSSIVQAIFRLALNEGLIDIDNYDTATLGLHDLRKKISIIPQEPVLFNGTVRFNLDPFSEKSDAELWQALADVKLKQHIQRLDGGLDCGLHDGGSNLSIGQRQLMCMARAILRQNKILIMDEPTANVDPETDRLIQSTLHSNFSDCTVLTIAHRLHTIMDNDRIVVMDAGRMVELGHPHILLQNQAGFLHALVERTGQATAQQLRHLAEESYAKRMARTKTD